MDYLVHHLVRTAAARCPDGEALVHRHRRLSYDGFAAQVTRLAEGLRRAGINRGDRVGILLPPSFELAISIFGISQAGAVFVPIHPSLLPRQVAHIANDCEMSALVTSARKLDDLRSEPTASLRCGFLTGAHAPIRDDLRVERWAELMARAPAASPDVAIGKDLAAILYTSGSTGKPKGVMLSHANLLAGASIVSTYLEITRSDRILAALPLSFDAGLNQLMTACQQGATTVMLGLATAAEIIRALVDERITGLAGVPTLWSMLTASQALGRTPFPHLRYITNTGGTMPLQTLDRLGAALPETEIVLMYGLTEAFRSTYLPSTELALRPTSMGRAIPDTEILVVDDDGQPCGAHQVGELVHRGPTVSLGYWGQPELTRLVLRPHPFDATARAAGELVCYSGDLVRRDEEGYLYFVGRRDHLIKSSGFRISPTEVEDVLYRSGQLESAAVIGVPHERLGQAIRAFVVSTGGRSLDTKALRSFSATLLPSHMVPSQIEAIDRMPTTSSGKIDYPVLRRRAATQCEAAPAVPPTAEVVVP